jgi:hypothetical protein
MEWINLDHNQDQWMALVSMVMVPQRWRKYWQTEPVSVPKSFLNQTQCFPLSILRCFIWSYSQLLQTFKNEGEKNPMRTWIHVQNVWTLQILWKLRKRNGITERNRAHYVDNIWKYLSPLSFCMYMLMSSCYL